MKKKLSIKDKQFINQIQVNEIIGHHMYKTAAAITKDEKISKILIELSDDELEHCQAIEEMTGLKVEISQSKIKKQIFKTKIIGRLFGITFLIKYFEKIESKAHDIRELSRFKELKKFIDNEEKHEEMLISLVKEERLKYTGSIVLGLNDALVELTGALAGFTLSIQNSRSIAILGLITGISASFSMAASEYLSTKTEGEQDGVSAKKASLYTGLAYVFTVFVLILPFVFVGNYIVALIITMLLAILIIALFNYYISIAQGFEFKHRFIEMALISLGVATISFAIGYLVNSFFGLEV